MLGDREDARGGGQGAVDPCSSTAMRSEQLLTCGRPLIDLLDGQIGRGILTGADEALILDKPTRDRLVILEPRYAPLLRRVLCAADLHPWHQQDPMRYLLLPQEADLERHAPLRAYLEPLRARLERRDPAGRRWFEPLDVPPLALLTPARLAWARGPDLRCSLVPAGPLLSADCGFALTDSPFLLGLLGSRLARQLLALLAPDTLPDPVARLPVPEAAPQTQALVGRLALALSAGARERYELEQGVRLRILRDFGPPGAVLSPALHAWWSLDDTAFRAELRWALNNDIPERVREPWLVWLAEQRQAHTDARAALDRLAAQLDATVDELFGLAPAQRQP